MKKADTKIKSIQGITAILAAAFVFFFLGNSPSMAKEITSENVLSLINQSRMLYGLNVIKKNDLLMKAASEKMSDMFSNDYFSHTSPKGTTPWYWIEKNGYDYKYAGENLAVDFKSVERQHKAWMESATHRKNILNSNYQEVGIAVGEGKIDGKETILTVQLFGTKVNAPVVAEQPASPSGDVQGEEKALAEPEKNEIAFSPQDVVPITLPAENQSITIEQGYSLVNRDNLIRQAAWIFIAIIFSLSIFINVSLLRRSGKFHILHPAN